LRLNLEPAAGSVDTLSEGQEGASPEHKITLRSQLDVTADVSFDAHVRYVDELPDRQVPDYTSLDLRLGWTPRPELELAIVGQNLLEARHPEFGSPVGRREIERGGYAELTWRW
jgi:iron complex outermembrane receptor protein